MEVTSSKPVTLSQVKDILEKREKDEIGEFGYEQQQTAEHAKKFVKHSSKEDEAMIKEIMKNKKINLETAIKIVDTLPKTTETLKTILLRDKIELTEEELNEIQKIIG